MPVVVPIKILQGLLCVVGAYFLCALSVLTVRKIVSVPLEVSRKLLHLSAIIVLTVWLYAFTDWRITEITIVLFAIAAHPILLFLLSIKNRSIKDRPTTSSFSNISSERSPGELQEPERFLPYVHVGSRCLLGLARGQEPCPCQHLRLGARGRGRRASRETIREE